MAPSRKSRQEKTYALPKRKTPIARTLPGDILLEIAARIDLRTLIRCAATCKRFRRDILSPHFLRRVSQAAPSILAYLCTDTKKHVTLVHPTTPAALSFCHNHLSRFLSRKAPMTLLGKYYEPLSSSHSLVLLRHVNIKNRPLSDPYNLCVYDPMAGIHRFFSNPPEIGSNQNRSHKCVLLTSADGIDYSFMLLVFEIYRWGIKVHTASSCGTWELVTYEGKNDFHVWPLNQRSNPAILHGGVIHWLSGHLAKNILRYDFGAEKMVSVKLPSIKCDGYDVNNLYLATSSDRKLLKLLAIQGFMMFVWLQLPASAADGSGWSLETVIDMEEMMRSLDPTITGGPNERIDFEGSGKRTGDVVFLQVVRTRHYKEYRDPPIVFDLETKKMHRQKQEFCLLEIDLPSRLQNMKIFS